MLTYQKIILVAVFLVLILIIADFLLVISPWFYIGTVLATVGLLAYGSVNFKSGYYCKVAYAGDKEERTLALTFDDGPDEKITPLILDILKENNVKAAFFCIGSRAIYNPELIKRIDSEGHIIGNHSYSHSYFFDLYSKRRILKELEENSKAIKDIIKKTPLLFRPPYGVTNPAVASAIRKGRYVAIGWSFKSKDTVIDNDETLLRRLVSGIENGSIILFHDTRRVTANTLDKFIKYSVSRNFSFKRLDHFLKIEAYE